MATMLSGSQGSVTIPAGEKGLTIDVTSWEATIEQDVFDATPFSVTDNARTKSLGMSSMSGTITGYLTDATSPELGNAATDNASPIADMVLQTSSGKTYTFAAVVSSMAVSVVKIGESSCVLSFTSSGAVAPA